MKRRPTKIYGVPIASYDALNKFRKSKNWTWLKLMNKINISLNKDKKSIIETCKNINKGKSLITIQIRDLEKIEKQLTFIEDKICAAQAWEILSMFAIESLFDEEPDKKREEIETDEKEQL